MWLALCGLLDALDHLWVFVGEHQIECRKRWFVQSPRDEFLILVNLTLVIITRTISVELSTSH